MLTVVAIMTGGIVVGYLLRRSRLLWIGKAVTVLVWLLLLVLGLEVGGSPRVMAALPSLGAEALLVAFMGVLGSAVAAKLLWRSVNRNGGEDGQ